MVVYLYRWKLKAGKENQFKSSWEIITKELHKNCGSLGSRLHLGSDGLYYGYAQWPDVETRNKASLDSKLVSEARAQMKDAIAESLPEMVLDPVADYLVVNNQV